MKRATVAKALAELPDFYREVFFDGKCSKLIKPRPWKSLKLANRPSKPDCTGHDSCCVRRSHHFSQSLEAPYGRAETQNSNAHGTKINQPKNVKSLSRNLGPHEGLMRPMAHSCMRPAAL